MIEMDHEGKSRPIASGIRPQGKAKGVPKIEAGDPEALPKEEENQQACFGNRKWPRQP